MVAAVLSGVVPGMHLGEALLPKAEHRDTRELVRLQELHVHHPALLSLCQVLAGMHGMVRTLKA